MVLILNKIIFFNPLCFFLFFRSRGDRHLLYLNTSFAFQEIFSLTSSAGRSSLSTFDASSFVCACDGRQGQTGGGPSLPKTQGVDEGRKSRNSFCRCRDWKVFWERTDQIKYCACVVPCSRQIQTPCLSGETTLHVCSLYDLQSRVPRTCVTVTERQTGSRSLWRLGPDGGGRGPSREAIRGRWVPHVSTIRSSCDW